MKLKFLLIPLILTLLLIGCGSQPIEVTVTKVVDGDTIWVSHSGEDIKVRYIGMDAPEIFGGTECYGEEASSENLRLVGGRDVYLTFDFGRYDSFGRTLAYVWLSSNTKDITNMVNYILVKEGYATVMTISPNIKYAGSFTTAEAYAAVHDLGLWAACKEE